MKTVYILLALLSLTGCQATTSTPSHETAASATQATVQPVAQVKEVPMTDADKAEKEAADKEAKLNTCQKQLQELRKYNYKSYKYQQAHLTKILNSQKRMDTSMSAASPEVSAFIKYQQNLSMDVSCNKIQATLNSYMIRSIPTVN